MVCRSDDIVQRALLSKARRVLTLRKIGQADAVQHARHRFTPVIMLTTEGQDEKKQAGKAAGARAWVVKPFNPPQLLDAVAKLILP
mgnify:CR=1 FL=1